MSVYDELNDLKLDLTEYEEQPLSDIERKKWKRRLQKKLRALEKNKKPHGKRWQKRVLVTVAAAGILLAGATLPAGKEALARLPFVSGLLENFTGYGEHVDYSAYKTQIGETAENGFGRLTLNEVLVDSDRLLITSTLEPTEAMNVEESDVIYLDAKVTINGRSDQQWAERGGAGSSGENGRYTTYQSIPFEKIPGGDKLDITIEYDHISWWQQKGKPTQPPEPWTFHIQTSRSALLAKTSTVEINRTIELTNGDEVFIGKIVSSPVSTTVYYDITKQAENESGLFLSTFKLVTTNGEEVPGEGASWSIDDGGQARYAPINLKQGEYSLIPIDGEKEKEMGEAIPIR
ncbi:DUF4179 domain-containing protein [Saccharibacillus kuerlensis]|uniref:DUF4179 domain-containing protein n=1 Tax=Saccharibacillus kuerlensis TaxID=459527 RepID=A0ABQ2L6B5_9BACL|nr:DUF4179 domain-containing protein [Saccharibacillus kuerlensis]GGO04930.1 hypothetical protein GCM10010969_30730 [Saccharibacillus kuerlensis]